MIICGIGPNDIPSTKYHVVRPSTKAKGSRLDTSRYEGGTIPFRYSGRSKMGLPKLRPSWYPNFQTKRANARRNKKLFKHVRYPVFSYKDYQTLKKIVKNFSREDRKKLIYNYPRKISLQIIKKFKFLRDVYRDKL